MTKTITSYIAIAQLLTATLLLVFNPGALASEQSSKDLAAQTPAVLNIAVAANFKTTLTKLTENFSRQFSDDQKPQLRIISGATGALFTQITQGAPFDLFFAADTQSAARLVDLALANKHHVQIYASGQLALAFKKSRADNNQQTSSECNSPIDNLQRLQQMLGTEKNRQRKTIVIANPTTAPYGAVALALLQSLSDTHRHYRLARGKNVLHAQQLLLSGSADLALLANSQQYLPGMNDFIFCPVGSTLAPEIAQSMAIIKSADANSARAKLALHFFHYIQSAEAKSIIIQQGYAGASPLPTPSI